MISRFRHKGLERFFKASDHRGIPAQHAARMERMLDRLEGALRRKLTKRGRGIGFDLCVEGPLRDVRDAQGLMALVSGEMSLLGSLFSARVAGLTSTIILILRCLHLPQQLPTPPDRAPLDALGEIPF